MKKTNWKHKRGERGSLEEEDNVLKLCNVADSVGEIPTVAATQPEPNLIDIKEVLTYKLQLQRYSGKTKK